MDAAQAAMPKLYFAYGSNMEPRRMKRRAPHCRSLGPARLPGHRLDFTRYSTGFHGGVADVVPDPEAEVWGVLYEVEESDLEGLDEYEGVPVGYRRDTVSVIDQKGREREASVYVANRTGHFAPRRAYMDLLLRGAREQGLPEEWIRHLESVKVV
jgi:gamma-glutamylcyclotransferase